MENDQSAVVWTLINEHNVDVSQYDEVRCLSYVIECTVITKHSVELNYIIFT